MTVAFHTFGCKLNQSESEALASAFRNQGFLIVPADQPADIIIVNTCTVTSKSEQKARRMIRHYLSQKPAARIIVTGCYAQLRSGDIGAISGDLIVLPHTRKDLLLDLPLLLRSTDDIEQIDSIIEGLSPSPSGREGDSEQRQFRFEAGEYTFHTRPFLKIQDGCSNSCAYCTVPLARGRSVSQSRDTLLRQVERLEAKGYREIVLTGVNISLYNDKGTDLAKLLSALLDASSRMRIRLSSLEPDGITDELLPVLASPRICPHFHLPVQSGSDKILHAMNRRYPAKRVMQAVEQLRKVKDDPFIAGDVIVGFPAEGEDEFNATHSLIEESDFTRLHVFQFSSRPGTAAAEMKQKIPERTAKERSRLLTALSTRLYTSYLKRWDTRTEEALAEKGSQGLTGNYLRVDIVSRSGAPIVPGEVYSGTLSVHNGKDCRLTAERTF